MARYLPDSNILIRYSRGNQVEQAWLQSMLNTREEVGVCAIVVAECLAGARPLERPGWAEVFTRLLYWDIEPEDAIQAGIWSFDWARRGRQLTTTDLIIAAVARRTGATLVTNNLKDFPMDDIDVQSLR